MIPPINIDISDTIRELSLSKEEVKDFSHFILDKVAYSYMNYWEREVDNDLKQTKTEYKSGMSYKYLDDYTVAFILSGKEKSRLGLMIENGASAFDMKQGFRNSEKAHNRGTDKWYLTIPFRHATSQAIAESGVFASIMPKPINNLAVRSDSPIRTSELPTDYQEKLTSRSSYQHKAPIYAGLNHIMSNDKTNEGYYTMRRVSENSEINAWLHPGFYAHNFMDKAFSKLTEQVGGIVFEARKEFLDKIL